MCCLHPPFDGNSLADVVSAITSGKYEHPPSLFSKTLRQVVEACLHHDYRRRPSAHQILKFLFDHNIVDGVDADLILHEAGNDSRGDETESDEELTMSSDTKASNFPSSQAAEPYEYSLERKYDSPLGLLSDFSSIDRTDRPREDAESDKKVKVLVSSSQPYFSSDASYAYPWSELSGDGVQVIRVRSRDSERAEAPALAYQMGNRSSNRKQHPTKNERRVLLPQGVENSFAQAVSISSRSELSARESARLSFERKIAEDRCEETSSNRKDESDSSDSQRPNVPSSDDQVLSVTFSLLCLYAC